MTVEEMNQEKEHKNMMIEIAFGLNKSKVNDVKEFVDSKEMCDRMMLVHVGDLNVLRSKPKILRLNYDDIRIKEGEKNCSIH